MTSAEGAPKKGYLPALRQSIASMRGGLSVWGLISIIIGVGADMAEPIGEVAVALFVFAALVAIMSGVTFTLRRLRPAAGPVFAFSLIAVAVFGAVLLFQALTPNQAAVERRGAVATAIPPLTGLQAALLPVSENERQLLRFVGLLSNPSATNLVRAREEIERAEEPMVQREMINALAQSRHAEFRQIGLLQALAQRQRETLQISPLENDGELALSLIGKELTVVRVDPNSGAVRFSVRDVNRMAEGTVTRDGLRAVIPHRCPPDGGLCRMALQASLGEDLRLTGTLVSDANEEVAVEIPLL